MSDSNLKAAAVPQSRLSRLTGMGTLAGRIAGNALIESGKQLLNGQKPRATDILLTEANIRQVADKLAKMRGAAMKVGQLLSMDSGNMLPSELAAILERLRADAMTMPPSQLYDVLERNWGEAWQDRFHRFSFEPIAAASIGQVHKATTHDGREMAVKIQYPGVPQSIDSDIDNVVSMMRLSGLLPKDLDIAPLVEEARKQLHYEADYLREGQQIEAYRVFVDSFHRQEELALPEYHQDLSTQEILCMSHLPGLALEKGIARHPSEADRVITLLMDLFFAELAQFRCVQTDPNLANYLYDPVSGCVMLLDFGAVRHFSDEFVGKYLCALRAATHEDRDGLRGALEALGFFQAGGRAANDEIVLDIFLLATEPLRHEGMYDFGKAELAKRIQTMGRTISSDPDAWHTPPPDVLFLHRKMGGLYLMAARLGAKVDAKTLFERHLSAY